MLDVAVKLRRLLPIGSLAAISLGCTLVACLPSLGRLFWAPSPDGFRYALINAALAFFLFSFQVHEKTILLPALPVMLVMPTEGLIAVWFQLIATFSMSPLLAKDGQTTGYIGCCGLFWACAALVPGLRSPVVEQQPRWLWRAVAASVAGAAAIELLSRAVAPPPALPHLWALAVCAYSFVHFAGFFVYFHLRQFEAVAPPRHGAGRIKTE